MVVQESDVVALVKAESLEMEKFDRIKIYVEDEKNRNVAICNMGAVGVFQDNA